MFSSRDLAQIIKYLFLATLLVFGVGFFFSYKDYLSPIPHPGAERTGIELGAFLTTSYLFLLPGSMVFTSIAQVLIAWPKHHPDIALSMPSNIPNMNYSFLSPGIEVSAIWFFLSRELTARRFPGLVGAFLMCLTFWFIFKKTWWKNTSHGKQRAVSYTLTTISSGN